MKRLELDDVDDDDVGSELSDKNMVNINLSEHSYDYFSFDIDIVIFSKIEVQVSSINL